MDEYLNMNHHNSKVKNPVSISIRLTLLISLTIIALLIIEFILITNYFINNSDSPRHDSYEFLTNRIADRVSGIAPEQNGLNNEELEGLLKGELNNQNVGAILLRGANGQLEQGYKKSRLSNKREALTSSSEIQGLLKDNGYLYSRKLSLNNRLYSLDIYFFNNSLSRTIKIFFYNNFLLITIFISLIIIVNFFLLKKLLVEPIFKLERALFTFLKDIPHFDNREKKRSLHKMVSLLETAGHKFMESLGRDNLTGLPNRDSLLSDISLSSKPCLFLINIDRFQQINDFYGNDIGDYILKETALRLKACLKLPLIHHNYKIYRLLSDEYAILLENEDSNIEELSSIIISAAFKDINDKTFSYDEHKILVRITIGVAEYKDGDIMTLLNKADMALKRAKRLKKQYLIYNETMAITMEYKKNLEWTFKLKSAVKDNRIIPYFQPIMNNRTGKIEKYECLARMLDSDGELVSPFYFLDIAKKNRLYSYITRIMIRKSFEIFKDTNYRFSINLSFFDIINKDTKMYIIHMLNRYRKITNNIVFEILESEGIENYKEIKEFINIVKAYGCKIAIDDFGTGYSNFAHIMKLDVDYLKLDASMIKNIDNDKNSYILTKNIINFANELGLETIAEYVHNDKILKIVKNLGINYSQGYHLGIPMDAPHDYIANTI